MNTRHLLPRRNANRFAPRSLAWLVLLLMSLPWLAQAQCPVADRFGNISLASQDQVDHFPAGCTNVPRILTVSGADITNLNGLKNLQSVGGDLQLQNNPQLTSIAALTALTSVGNNLQINSNALLTNLNGLNDLQSVGGDLRLEGNPQLTSLVALIALTRVSGSLQIDNDALLANVDGLNNIQSVGGDLRLESDPQLTSLAGLTSLTSVSGSLQIDNDALLANLNGLNKLQSVGGDLRLENNPQLTSIAALAALTRVGNRVQISNDALLTNLNGLNNLQSVGNNLTIQSNPQLTSLQGLNNLTSVKNYLYFEDNNRLSQCAIASICALLATNITTYISGNAPGCNSAQDIQADCTPLAITAQPPTGSTVCVGSTVTATVSTTGNARAYQWYKGNQAVSGQTSATLTLTNVQPVDAGTYVVVVSNSVSSLTSTAFTLTVTPQSQDYQALVDLYNSTNGLGWTRKDNWLTGCTPCGWYGVTCDGNGRVINLILVNNKLSGSLPASLSALTRLQYLDLSQNQLSGSIPASLSALTNLADLSLYSNQLSGSIPASLSALTNLQILDLFSNQLSGSIPASLSALTSLQYLYLFNNQLSGSIPASLSALTRLQYLDLSNNQLSGSIPASLSALTKLQYLYLFNNQLSGCFPASLSALCGKTVDFSSNPGLPGGGDFRAFCASGAGSDAFRPLATASPNPVCAGNPVSLSVTTGTFYQWSGPAGFSATTQTPTFTPATAASSGLYSVTVGNGSPTCTATTSVSLTVNPLPTVSIVGLPASICQEAAPVTLTGNPAGGTFTIDGTPATSFTPASLSVGQHTVVYSYTNTSGCSNTASQMVTIKATPQTPIIATQSGHSYPGGVSSLTASQNTGNIILTASGCAGGTITWAGGNSTTLSVSTMNTGVQTFSATCSQNGCTSPLATARVTVVGTTLSVLHRDGNGQTNTNTLAPYLQLNNDGKTAIPYSEITVRYWLTVENYSPLQFNINYAQLGSDKVHLKYVPAPTGNPTATGYIEFSFDGSAGSLAPMSNSGPIQDLINKQDYSYFDQSNDYSYAAVGNFTPNQHITAYRNGVLFYGMEPGPVAPTLSVKAQTQNNTAPDANTIEAVLQVTNDGNQPINYSDLKVRYYFTADNTQPLVLSQAGYTALGASNVTAQLVAINPALAGADRYLEVSFSPGLGQLAPGSGTGGVTYQLRHADYSGFNQTNDYSYQGTGGTMLNPHVVVFVAGQRVYGTEPGAGARLAVEAAEVPLSVRVLGNPLTGSVLELEVTGAEGQPLRLQLSDSNGRLVGERRVEQAGAVERQTLPVGGQSAGLLLLRVSTPTQSQTVKVLKTQ